MLNVGEPNHHPKPMMQSDGAGAVAGGSGNSAIVMTVVVAMAVVLMISTIIFSYRHGSGDIGSASEDRNEMPTTTQTCSVLAVCFGT